jgi:DNA-binding NarL/FixJ family response regulator
MTRLLEDDGLEVVGDADIPDTLVEEARRLQPDAIVIGLDRGRSSELTERVRIAAPGAKVILWARDETEMRVFDPGSSAPRRVDTSASAALLRELKTGGVTGRE